MIICIFTLGQISEGPTQRASHLTLANIALYLDAHQRVGFGNNHLQNYSHNYEIHVHALPWIVTTKS